MNSNEIEGRERARQFRSEHGLGDQPIPDVAHLIERTVGVDVAILDAPAGEHGLTIHDPDAGRTIIGVARTPHPMRLRSTLAHELCHALFQDWLASDEDLGERRPAEVRADAFARHLLIPEEGLRRLAEGRDADEALLSELCQTYGVSPAIAAIAAGYAGVTGPVLTERWKDLQSAVLATRHGWRDEYNRMAAESNEYRAPQRLLARAVAGYREEVLSAQVVASLRHLPVAYVESELREAGIAPGNDELSTDSGQERWEASLITTGVDLSELDALLADDGDL